jgi:hypothetical protein
MRVENTEEKKFDHQVDSIESYIELSNSGKGVVDMMGSVSLQEEKYFNISQVKETSRKRNQDRNKRNKVNPKLNL